MGKIEKTKLIAITGGSGFIGRHLVRRLINDGYRINLLVHKQEFEHPSVRIIRGDIVSAKGLDRFLKNTKVVIHLAGRFTPPNLAIFQANVAATFNLLEKCAEYKIEKIIFSSGIALYGEPSGKAWRETDLPKPNTVYGLSKFLAEKIIEYWGVQGGFKHFFLRFPNIYGQGNQKGVIFNFLRAIEKKGGVTIYGDGRQQRDFLFINDAVEAIVKTLNYNGPSDVFNIASGKTVSLLELVALLEKILKRNIPVEFSQPEAYVVRILSGEIKKAKNILSWQPTIGLVEGLKLTLKGERK